ncbi:MAG TPA: GAF and ANTAR domain-containing protein [Pseudonocardiaceae bacterium]
MVDEREADELQWERDKAEFIQYAHDLDHPIDRPGPSPLVAQFAALTRALLDADTVTDVLDHVVRVAQRVIPGVDLASVTLRTPDGGFHTPVETSRQAFELDQVQYRTGEGPCLDAANLAGPGHVRSDDLAHEPAWPTFGPAAAAHGFTAVLATVLLPDARPPRLSGALNLYARHPGVLDPQAEDIALLLASHASLALAGTQAVALAELQQAQLRRALDSRDVIGQAKGILMSRRGISAAEAFDLLRRTSQDLNVKLVQIAETLATRHTELDPPVGA